MRNNPHQTRNADGTFGYGKAPEATSSAQQHARRTADALNCPVAALPGCAPPAPPDSEHRTLWRGLYFGEVDASEIAAIQRDPLAWVARMMENYDHPGIHWTDVPSSAYNFAENRDPEGNPHDDFGWDDEDDPEELFSVGLVLEAEVLSEHVIEEGSQEWEDYAFSDAIFASSHPEAEVTLREGSPVPVCRVAVVWSDADGNTNESLVDLRALDSSSN